MKFALYIFCFVMWSLNAFPQINNTTNTTSQKLDSTLNTGDRKDLFFYDSLGRNTEWLVLNDHPLYHYWMKGAKTIYEYNSGNQLVVECYYKADDPFTAWNPQYRYEYFYDLNKRDTLKIRYNWNSGANSWKVIYKDCFTYLQNGKLALTESYQWDAGYNQWKIVAKEERTYNSNNEMLSNISYDWDNSTNAWIGSYKFVYTYDNQNNRTSEIFSIWGYDFPNTWGNFYAFIYSYDNYGNLTEMLGYDWICSWELRSRYLNNYDTTYSKDSLILPVSYDYHEIGQKYYYFRKHKIINSTGFYRTNQNTWEPTGDSTIYYYSDFIPMSPVEEEAAISIFPNPALTQITITGLDPHKSYNAQVYDIQGKLIKNQIINKASLNVSELKSGLYILEIISEGRIAFRTKIIKY